MSEMNNLFPFFLGGGGGGDQESISLITVVRKQSGMRFSGILF